MTITTSFDVWKHEHNHIELYGREAALIVTDPNQFQGKVMVSEGKGDWSEVPQTHGYGDGNYRILGLAGIATAIRSGRPHRAGLGLALHVLEVMEAITRSSQDGRRITLAHPADRPAAMVPDLPMGQLDAG